MILNAKRDTQFNLVHHALCIMNYQYGMDKYIVVLHSFFRQEQSFIYISPTSPYSFVFISPHFTHPYVYSFALMLDIYSFVMIKYSTMLDVYTHKHPSIYQLFSSILYGFLTILGLANTSF